MVLFRNQKEVNMAATQNVKETDRQERKQNSLTKWGLGAVVWSWNADSWLNGQPVDFKEMSESI